MFSIEVQDLLLPQPTNSSRRHYLTVNQTSFCGILIAIASMYIGDDN